MATEDDIEKIRSRILKAAEIPPPIGRRKRDSKAEKVRALMAELLAYRKRYPYATDKDVLVLLQDAGVDVKLDTVRKVMREQKKPRTVARRGRRVVTGVEGKADAKGTQNKPVSMGSSGRTGGQLTGAEAPTIDRQWETDRPLAAAPEEHAATRRAGRKP
jgi:hypothetical protein